MDCRGVICTCNRLQRPMVSACQHADPPDGSVRRPEGARRTMTERHARVPGSGRRGAGARGRPRRYCPAMDSRAGSTGITHRYVDARGLRMHIAEAGSGPLVLLLHGFPESWYSWRHQLTALADAGFHAVAPDQRGYCRTEAPERADLYTILHLTGDVIALLDALGADRVVVAGHDWGAPVAWHTALLRPDRVRGVIGLSVPYRPRGSSAPWPVRNAQPDHAPHPVRAQQRGMPGDRRAPVVPGDDHPVRAERVEQGDHVPGQVQDRIEIGPLRRFGPAVPALIRRDRVKAAL